MLYKEGVRCVILMPSATRDRANIADPFLRDDTDAAFLWTLKKRYENKRIYVRKLYYIAQLIKSLAISIADLHWRGAIGGQSK